jgi:hypothetical protein
MALEVYRRLLYYFPEEKRLILYRLQFNRFINLPQFGLILPKNFFLEEHWVWFREMLTREKSHAVPFYVSLVTKFLLMPPPGGQPHQEVI